MRKANQLAVQATKKGNNPFGAALVHNEEIIAEAENTVHTNMDFTRHAELNLVVEAYNNFDKEVLQESTLYASTAPCIMCAYAIKYAGITRVVYGVRYETFAKLMPEPYQYISVEEVYRLHDTPLEATGGVLEGECLDSYKFWPKDH